MRLVEGFNFTYSAAGIMNMVLEVQMQGVGKGDALYPCIIQYILFPPHVTSNTTVERDSASEEDTDEGKNLLTFIVDCYIYSQEPLMYFTIFNYVLGTADGEVSMDDFEGFGDFQIVSEIWIEPQCGFSQLPAQSTAAYMHQLQYHEIPDAVSTYISINIILSIFICTRRLKIYNYP